MTTLGQAAEIKTGFPFRSADFSATGVRLLRGDNIGQGRLRWENAARWDAETSEEYALMDGDVVLAMDRPWIGAGLKLARVHQADLPALLVQRVARFRAKAGVDQRFLEMALKGPSFSGYLQSIQTGTAVPHVSSSQIKDFQLRLPSLSEQQAIAGVLGALDDKIAANDAVARTSDGLARALFDRVTSTQAETVRVDTLVSNVREQFSPRKSEEQIYVGLEHLPRRLMWCTQTGTSAQISSTKAVFSNGDILFGKLRPYFHKVVSAPAPGVCSTDILVCRPREVDLAGFALAALASDAVVARCSAAAEGTRMPRASWADLAACEIGWPGLDDAVGLSETVLTLRAAAQAYLSENRTLAELRDTLLPALMSGRLRVKDAERQVEDAV